MNNIKSQANLTRLKYNKPAQEAVAIVSNDSLPDRLPLDTPVRRSKSKPLLRRTVVYKTRKWSFLLYWFMIATLP